MPDIEYYIEIPVKVKAFKHNNNDLHRGIEYLFVNRRPVEVEYADMPVPVGAAVIRAGAFFEVVEEGDYIVIEPGGQCEAIDALVFHNLYQPAG